MNLTLYLNVKSMYYILMRNNELQKTVLPEQHNSEEESGIWTQGALVYLTEHCNKDMHEQYTVHGSLLGDNS